MKANFQYYTKSDKMPTLVGCDKSFMNSVIYSRTPKNYMKWHTV
jgi:hypothetical protein